MDRLGRIAVGEHVGDVMDRHPRSGKDGLAAKDIGIPSHHRLRLPQPHKAGLDVGSNRLEIDLQRVGRNHRCSIGRDCAFDDRPSCHWRQRLSRQPCQTQSKQARSYDDAAAATPLHTASQQPGVDDAMHLLERHLRYRCRLIGGEHLAGEPGHDNNPSTCV